MYNDEIYNDNDYVYFKGNYSYNIEDERSFEIGKIKEYDEQSKKFLVYLITTKRDVCCSDSQLQTIATKEKHLLFMGFKKLQGGAFRLNTHAIFNFVIPIQKIETCVISGLCLLKPDRKIDYKKYVVDNEFNTNLFYENFPDMGELNNFIRFLRSQELEFDEMELLKI